MSGQALRGQVNLVVALSCEARPLIEHYKLLLVNATAGMRLYSNRDGIDLIVCGIGKQAIAMACGFLAGQQNSMTSPVAAWLNIGIAGHGSLPLGEGVLAHRVVDQVSGRASYPPMILTTERPSTTVVTVEKPVTDYPQDVAYDMEASAFSTTASRFVTSELVQIYKVVSDNPQSPVEGVSAARISDWIENNLQSIDSLVSQLRELSREYNELYTLPPEFFSLADRVHLTASQRVKLESGYRRFYALGGTSLGENTELCKVSTGKELLNKLDALMADL